MQDSSKLAEINMLSLRFASKQHLDSTNGIGEEVKSTESDSFWIDWPGKNVFVNSKDHYWRFSAERQEGVENQWCFKEAQTVDSILAFCLRMGKYQDIDAKALQVKPIQKEEFEVNGVNCYPYEISINGASYSIFSPNDYEELQIIALNSEEWGFLHSVVPNPGELFYSQYAAFNHLPASVYQEVVNVDSAFRRFKVSLETQDNGVFVSIRQYEDGIKFKGIVENPKVIPPRRKGPENFFANTTQDYILKLEQSYIRVAFTVALILRDLVPLGTVDGCGVFYYKDMLYQLSSYSAVYLTEFNLMRDLIKGNHALISSQQQVSDTYDVREIRESTKIAAPMEDIHEIAEEAWYQQEEQKLKPSEVPNKRRSLIRNVLMILLLMAFIAFEIVSAIYGWQLSFGMFDQVSVWSIGLCSATLIVALLAVGVYTHHAWQRYANYRPGEVSLKAAPSDELGGSYVFVSNISAQRRQRDTAIQSTLV